MNDSAIDGNLTSATNDRVRDIVKLFNVKKCSGFINHHGTREDTFVRHGTITRSNPHKIYRSVV